MDGAKFEKTCPARESYKRQFPAEERITSRPHYFIAMSDVIDSQKDSDDVNHEAPAKRSRPS
jgi:hypothetical protein